MLWPIVISKCEWMRIRHIICQIVRAFLFLGKQGLPFRGDNEDLNITKNPGNFLALLKCFSVSDSILFDHLNKPRAKNATYISSRSQNEIINVIGHDIILANIVAEVKQSNFYSVLADEVSCHNVEQLPVCLRFVDSEGSIREEFVAFLKLNRVRAADIADALVKCLENLGLSLSELRGQGYDGASTMGGHKSGVQARIREKQPKAVYTHCASHSLNLVIVKSCSVPEIRNCIDSIKSITIWVKYSPKREALLKAIAGECTYPASRQTLLNICITRWVESIDGWERFSLAHPFLVKMFEVILYGSSDFPLFNDGWSSEDKQNALAHMKKLECFEFVYSMVTLSRSLLYLKQAVVNLQGKNKDIVSGVSTVMQCCEDLKKVREDIEAYSQRIYLHSCRIAEKSGIFVSIPRTVRCQQHRSNPESSSVADHMKKVLQFHS